MRFAFVSNNTAASWGGSEELWAQTAAILSRMRHKVIAIVPDWHPKPEQWQTLASSGVEIRPMTHLKKDTITDLLMRGLGREITTFAERQVSRKIVSFRPDLIILSQMLNWDALPWMEACQKLQLPYVIISQAAAEFYWPTGRAPSQLRQAFSSAKQLFFVSNQNKRLTEIQVARSLPNSTIVPNPFLVDYHTKPTWPKFDLETPLRLACVARYSPHVKGHDILFEVLGQDKWRNRALTVTCFGTGDRAELDRLATFFGAKSVTISMPVKDLNSVWLNHHGLVLASRFEGLPLAIVEAMLSHRPCFVTPAGGNSEVIRQGVDGLLSSGISTNSFDDMLERAWLLRDKWQLMGLAAGAQIRKIVPANPADDFARKLLSLCN